MNGIEMYIQNALRIPMVKFVPFIKFVLLYVCI